jgi:hypothetical protein
MKKDKVKEIIRIILTAIFVIIFLILCGYIQIAQMIWHDTIKYFDSPERVGHVLGAILLLAMFGFLFYCIGYIKGIDVGKEIQQNPRKFDELR